MGRVNQMHKLWEFFQTDHFFFKIFKAWLNPHYTKSLGQAFQTHIFEEYNQDSKDDICKIRGVICNFLYPLPHAEMNRFTLASFLADLKDV